MNRNLKNFLLVLPVPTLSILHTRWLLFVLGGQWNEDARFWAMLLALVMTFIVTIRVFSEE